MLHASTRELAIKLLAMGPAAIDKLKNTTIVGSEVRYQKGAGIGSSLFVRDQSLRPRCSFGDTLRPRQGMGQDRAVPQLR